MTKYAFKSVIKAMCEIAEFVYTVALTVVKGTCNCVQATLERI